MISLLQIVAGSLEAFEGLDFFSNFIIMMLVVTALSDWVGQFLKEAIIFLLDNYCYKTVKFV